MVFWVKWTTMRAYFRNLISCQKCIALLVAFDRSCCRVTFLILSAKVSSRRKILSFQSPTKATRATKIKAAELVMSWQNPGRQFRKRKKVNLLKKVPLLDSTLVRVTLISYFWYFSGHPSPWQCLQAERSRNIQPNSCCHDRPSVSYKMI